MGKKEVKNKYGVQIGDIFNDGYRNGCNYYQVVELRGETKIVVREIEQNCIAFDGYYECLAPEKSKWASCNIHICEPQISTNPDEELIIDVSEPLLGTEFYCSARLYRDETYLACKKNEHFPFYFRDAYPEIAVRLDLRKGSGVYAKDKSFKWLDDDSIAVIRYPDGRESEISFQELMCSKKITKKVKREEAEFKKLMESLKMPDENSDDRMVRKIRHTKGKYGRFSIKWEKTDNSAS